MSRTCPPAASIRSLLHLGAAPILSGEEWTLAGQDGGQSIDLKDSTLFVFSDTLLAKTAALESNPASRTFSRSNSRFLANCAGIAREPSLRDALSKLEFFSDADGWPREIVQRDLEERLTGHRFWPEHGVLIGNMVYLFYVGVQQVRPRSTWGFEITGSGLASLDPTTGQCERVRIGGDWRLWRATDARVHWGVQTLAHGEHIYVFGTRREGPFRMAVLARVPADRIADSSAYEYLSSDAPSWSGNPEDAFDLVSCSSEYSVSYNPYLRRYLMIYADGYEKILYLRTAEEVWGPYSESLRLGKLPYREDAEIVSQAFEHPKFAKGGGQTVIVSYCQPHFTQNSLVSITFD